MHNIKTLSVTFAEPIEAREIHCFRGAIAEKVGLEREYYHNHNNDPAVKQAYHYRYPLIQYRLYRSRPQLLFINEAIDEARHFFGQSEWNLNMAGRPYPAQVERLKAGQTQLGLLPETQAYTIRRWLALNGDNYDRFAQTERLTTRIETLERILAGNILSMASGLGYRFPARFELFLTESYRQYSLPYKGTRLMAFDTTFRTNVQLPLGFSVGKGSSLGFGRVGKAKPTKTEQTTTQEVTTA